MADAITNAGGDYVLALKRNQPTLHGEVERYFADPDTAGLQECQTIDKDHGRVEVRDYVVSHDVGWLHSDRRYPGDYRFPAVKSLVKTTTTTHWRGKTTCETRYFISSAMLSPERADQAIRGHWGIESLHWVLDVIFKEDQSRLRHGHGARNMALVRRLAFNIVRVGAERIHQNRTQSRRMGPPIPRLTPHDRGPLTSTRCRGQMLRSIDRSGTSPTTLGRPQRMGRPAGRAVTMQTARMRRRTRIEWEENA